MNELKDLAALATTPEDWAYIDQQSRELEAQRTQAAEQNTYIVHDIGEVAAFFGLATVTVKEWRVGADPMPGEKGRWDLREIVRWKLEKTQRLSQPLSEVQRMRQAAEARNKMAQAEQRELILAQKKGELLIKSDVEIWVTQALIEAREALLRLPHAVASSVPVEIREPIRLEVEGTVYAVLDLLEKRLSDDAPRGTQTPATAAED